MSDNLIQSWFVWLNSNSGAVNSILVALLVIITGAYVFLTSRLVTESKKFRELSLRPALVVTAELHETLVTIVNFRIENIGGGAAYGIRLQTNRKFIVGNEDPLNKLGFFKYGIPSLGPGRILESFLATGPDLLKSQQEEIEGTVTYSDATGRKFEEKFVLSFSSFENLSRVGEPPLQTIADSIKKLQENIKSVTNGLGKLSVLAYSLDDLDAVRSAQKLHIKLRRVSPDGRKEIEKLIDQEISRGGTKG